MNFPITDDLGEEAVVIQRNTEDSRLAVVERAHGVEGVRGADCSGVDGGECLGGESIRMAERDPRAERDRVAYEVQRSG